MERQMADSSASPESSAAAACFVDQHNDGPVITHLWVIDKQTI